MQQVQFPQFLEKFPPVPMPVTLGEDDHHTFSMENEPLTEEMIARFIHPLETVPDDEFTEYVPCFSLEDTPGFAAIVYWKAGLMTYDYVLATFRLTGEPIGRQTIAGTAVVDEKIRRTVATIDEEWLIYMAEGEAAATSGDFDPTATRTRNMEILMNGEIVEDVKIH